MLHSEVFSDNQQVNTEKDPMFQGLSYSPLTGFDTNEVYHFLAYLVIFILSYSPHILISE
jgi:hypothetical protein